MKTFKRFVVFGLTLSIIMCSTAAPTFASESTQGRASNSTEVHDFLVSGLAAAEAVSEFEDTTKTKFSVEDFSNLNITDDWEADAEAFLNDYLASRSIYRIIQVLTLPIIGFAMIPLQFLGKVADVILIILLVMWWFIPTGLARKIDDW